MKSPTVHIVTLNWNGLADTLECLESISKLTYPTVTAIVVDNGSRNSEAETIEERFPEVVVLKQSENLGFCGGCNVGIKYAIEQGADFVMLLNNDALVTPGLINELLTQLDLLENVGAVSPLILNYPDKDEIWFAKAKWIPEKASFSLDPERQNARESQNQKPYLTFFACGCCLLAPASVFSAEGLLDERYFAFYDEAEWCARIRRNGWESYVVPSAVVYHKGSRSTPSAVSGYLMTRNRMLWMKENLSIGVRLKSFTFLLKDVLGNVGNLLRLTKEHQSKKYSSAVVRGYLDYFRRKFYKWDKSAESKLFGG